jgi:hypothetical protein
MGRKISTGELKQREKEKRNQDGEWKIKIKMRWRGLYIFGSYSRGQPPSGDDGHCPEEEVEKKMPS